MVGRFSDVARSGAGRRLLRAAVTVLRDVTGGGVRELTLVSSRRDASTLGFGSTPVAHCSAARRSAAGTSRPTDPRGKWAFGFRFHGAPVDGVEVQLELDQRADGVTVRVADSTHDLGVVPGFTPPPQGRVLVTPAVVVTRALLL